MKPDLLVPKKKAALLICATNHSGNVMRILLWALSRGLDGKWNSARNVNGPGGTAWGKVRHLLKANKLRING